MQNNDCIHKFGGPKPIKKVIADCDADGRAALGTTVTRKCKKCGLVVTEFQPAKKGGKHLGLKMR